MIKVKNVIIAGNSDFAKLMLYYVTEYSDKRVCGFTVESAYISPDEREINGLPVVPLESIVSFYPPESHEIILGIGHSQMGNVRKKIFQICKSMNYEIARFIHPTAIIAKNAEIGEGTIILEKTLVQPFCKIGSANLLWDDVCIAHNSTLGDYNTLSGTAGVSGNVIIGNNCYIGKHGMLFDKIKIADFTLIGAGAYAKHDTKPYDVIVPARSITLEGKKSIEYI